MSRVSVPRARRRSPGARAAKSEGATGAPEPVAVTAVIGGEPVRFAQRGKLGTLDPSQPASVLLRQLTRASNSVIDVTNALAREVVELRSRIVRLERADAHADDGAEPAGHPAPADPPAPDPAHEPAEPGDEADAAEPAAG